jgi:hypothetical protein
MGRLKSEGRVLSWVVCVAENTVDSASRLAEEDAT